MVGEETTCSRTGNYCVDSGFRLETEDCTWTRKLCVTCDYDSFYGVTINMQSNGLPRKCFWTEDRELTEQNIDFTVEWNQAMQSADNPRVNIGTNDALYTEEMCDWTNTSSSKLFGGLNLDIAIGANQMNEAVGVALDGVLIYKGLLTDYEIDPFYPISYNSVL